MASIQKIISNVNELVKVFNKHYINIIEKSGGQKPTNNQKSFYRYDKQAVELIYNSYRNHPSLLKIKSNTKTKGNNNNKMFSSVSSDNVRKMLQKLNPGKAIGYDKIPPALIKITAEPLSAPL